MVPSADLEIVAHLFQPFSRDGVMLRGALQNIFCVLNRLVDDLLDFVHGDALCELTEQHEPQALRRQGKALRVPFRNKNSVGARWPL